jgi:hypothetical protein
MSVRNEIPHSSYFSPPNHWNASAYIGKVICSILRLHPINKDDTSLVSPAEPLTCQNLSPFQAHTTAALLFVLNTSSRMTGYRITSCWQHLCKVKSNTTELAVLLLTRNTRSHFHLETKYIIYCTRTVFIRPVCARVSLSVNRDVSVSPGQTEMRRGLSGGERRSDSVLMNGTDSLVITPSASHWLSNHYEKMPHFINTVICVSPHC